MLELHGRRQHDVGVLDGVRAEMLGDHREEIGPLQPPLDLRLVRHAGEGVAGVDEQCLDRRVVYLEQALPEPRHAQRPGAGPPQVVAVQGRPVQPEEPARVVPGAAAGIAPIPRDAGNARDGPGGHPAAAVPLEPHRQPDPGGPGVREALPQVEDRLRREAADLGDPLRRILEDAGPERLPAMRVLADEVLVLRALGEHDVHEAERQRGIGPGNRRQVRVGGVAGPRPDRVDDDEMRALLAGRGDAAPEVMVRGQGVAAPQDDEPREAQRLRIHPHAVVAERVAGPDPAGDRADRHQVVGRPERVPQPAPRAVHALEEPHAAGADVGPDGLGAEIPDRAGQPLGDLVERLVPGDALEVSAPLGTAAPHRMEQAIRRLGVGDVAVHLVAQDAASEGMRGIALQPHGAPVLHGDDPAAGVRAIERARAEDLARAVRSPASRVRSAVHGDHPRHAREP